MRSEELFKTTIKSDGWLVITDSFGCQSMMHCGSGGSEIKVQFVPYLPITVNINAIQSVLNEQKGAEDER